MTLEKTTKSIPADYEHLFEVGDRVQANKNKEIEAIILEVCSADRKIQFEIKINLLKIREQDQDAQTRMTDAKVAVQVRKRGLILDSAGVACEMGAAFFGGQASSYGLGFQAVGRGWNTTSQYVNKKSESEITSIDYSYQRTNSLLGERSQFIQGAEKQHDQASATMDRITQLTHRSFELVASGNG